MKSLNLADRGRWMVMTGIILLAGALWIAFSAAPNRGGSAQGLQTAPREGFLAPDFTLQDLNGQTYTLSDLRGQAVLLNFWATWCPPCRAEMPAIAQVYEDYRGQGFLVLAVTADDTRADAAAFAAEYGLPFPILTDSSATAARAYRITSLPTSFFITPQGIIQKVVIGGPMSEAGIRANVEGLLK